MTESREKLLEQDHDILNFMEAYVKRVQVAESERIKVFVVTMKRNEEKTATGGSVREAVLTLMRGSI